MANFDFYTWLKSRKNTVEKYLALLLCVVLLMTGFPVVSFAETGTETGHLKNGGFESFNRFNFGSYLQSAPETEDVWKTTAQEGKMEVLRENFGTYISGYKVKPREGNIAAELNADEESSLYQIVDTEPSSLYEWGISHAARTDSDTMALIIGPNQEVAPSKNMGEGYDKGDFNTLKTGYKYGKDQMMQMVAWLKSMGQISNYENKGIANDGKPVIMYSKKFAALGGFQDNADNQPFSMKSSSVYTEKWYVWIITDKKEFDSSNTLIWGDYGSNDENNANRELDLDSYYLYSVPSGQTKTLFAFTSVENKPNTGSKYPDPTYGNFLDGVNFKLYRVLSGGSTAHGSAVLGSSDGSTSGTGGTTGYEITSGNDVLTYVEDGKALEIQAKIAAVDKTEVSFAGVFMTVQNLNGTGSVRKFISSASGWTITEDENGNRIFKTQIDSITSATDLYFVFVRSPMIVYDSNGGKAYQCNQQEHPENEKNIYCFQPVVNGEQVDFINPYTAHAAEGQNDAWKFVGWSLFDNESFRTELVPGKHTVAYNQQLSGGEGNKFIVLGGDDSFYRKVENETGVKWETLATPLYEKSAPGLMFIAQWRWRQVFVPKTDEGAGLNESDNGGTVKVTSISNPSDENYNNSYSDKGAVAYYAELNETVTAKATAKEGYYFDGWYDKDGNQVTKSDTITFTESKEAINTYSAHFIKLYEQRFIRQIKNNSGEWENLQDNDVSKVELLDRTNISEILGAPVSSTAANNSNYGLVGWYDSEGIKVPDNMLLNDGKTLKYDVAGDATYYARFEPAKTVKFMIQFVNNNGSLSTEVGSDENYGKLSSYSANGVIGDIVSSKAYPSAGYELVGWYDSPESDANKVDCIDLTDSKIIKPEVKNEQVKTYYARFRARTDTVYKVQHIFVGYNSNGKDKTVIETHRGTTGESVTPTVMDLSDQQATYEGYAYRGDTITSAIIRADGSLVFQLYYTKTSTNLTYEANPPSGQTADGSVSSQSGYVGYNVTVSDNGFTVTGYKFNGWNTKADGTGTSYAKDENYMLLDNDSGGNNPNVLYAQWVPSSSVKYTVQHIKLDKSGTVINPPANEYVFYGTTGDLVTATVKSYPGYSFVEEYLGNIKQGYVLNDGSLVLKLHYKPNATKLTYIANGGIESDDTDNGYVDEVRTVKDETTFTRSGYTFTGWNTKADGSGTSYAAGSSYTLTAGEDILYAQWTPNTNTQYKVFHYKVSPDGMTATLVDTDNETGETGISVIAYPKAYAGYTYKSDFDSNGMKSTYIGTIAGDGSLVLKLYYIPNTVKLTYYPNGGQGSYFVVNGRYSEQITVLGNMFTRPGYTFTGWNTEETPSGGSGVSYSPNNTYTFGGVDGVLYAQWSANTNTQYKVEHYKVNADGTDATLVTSDIENLAGTTDTTVNATAKSYAGYTYAATFDQNSMKTVSSGTVAGDGSLVLKLYYTPDATTLTYKSNGGTGSDVIDNGHVDEVKTVKDETTFTRSGYTFTGWNTKADGSGTSYAAGSSYTLTVDEDVLYAQWEEVLDEEVVSPSSPTSPQNPTQPSTGDTVNLLSWLIVMVISILAMISILFYLRKKNK